MLIMVNGLAQRYQQDTNALSTTLFSDLSYDVSNLVGTKKVLKRGLSSISSYEMIVEQSLILQETKTPLERLHKEVHNLLLVAGDRVLCCKEEFGDRRAAHRWSSNVSCRGVLGDRYRR